MEGIVIGYNGLQELLRGFQRSGDWELDAIRLVNKCQAYYDDTVGVFHDGIREMIEHEVFGRVVDRYPERMFGVDHNGMFLRWLLGKTQAWRMCWLMQRAEAEQPLKTARAMSLFT